jgi:hypothetical protein
MRLSGVPSTMTDSGTAVRTTALVYYATTREGGDLHVMAGAKGHPLYDLRSFSKSKVVDGPSINGHPSKWYDLKADGYLLLWQWAPGAEGYLALRMLPNALPLATRLARSMTVDLAAPVRMPFTVQAPMGYQLSEFETVTYAGACRAATVAYGGPAGSYISITANPLGGGIGKPTTTYHGRPARTAQEADLTTTLMAAGDLKARGMCSYRANPTITAAQVKALCLATTASVKRTADLQAVKTWPVFVP